MEDTHKEGAALEAARSQRVQEGFNEFFDWHMRGYIEYNNQRDGL